MLQLTTNMPAIMNNPELWNAVIARDSSRDGSFVFAVRSTGIYCRPSCPARRPRREQVSFFQIPEDGSSVTDAMYDAGYGSSRGLYEKSSARLGMTPATYGRGGRGMRIIYTIAKCSLGRLLVAATERGVCSVALGDSDADLERALLSEYPNASIDKKDTVISPSLNLWLCKVLEYLNGKTPRVDLPLDLQATAFQWRVWEELRRIPLGETRSYQEIAKAIGKPKAVRAVASACAGNHVALVIPCHRVIREDQSLGGYRWGLERKRKLLENEKVSHSE